MNTDTQEAKRFNLWLPGELWRRLDRLVRRRSKEVEADVTPTSEIRRAIEKHLDQMEGKRS